MNYIKFIENASRKDAPANDMAHYFSHHFSERVAFMFFKVGASPNFVTWVFLFLGCSCAAFVWTGHPVLAFLMWRFHIIIDMADGTLARATQKFSSAADGFDRSNHIIINTAVLIASTQAFENDFIVLCLLVSFYLMYLFSRNYYTSKMQTYNFSLFKNFIKDAVGIEGYLFFTLVLQSFSFTSAQIFISSLYACFFLILYVVKLRFFSRQIT